MGEIQSNYDTKVYQLAANTPLALPSGSEYLILDCTVDPGSIGLALGSGNADFAAWPVGVAVRVPAQMNARIQSTVAQSVTLAVTSGDVSMRDGRVATAQLPGRGTVSSFGTITATSTPIIVAAALNPRGILVYWGRMSALLGAANSDISAVISGFTSGTFMHMKESNGAAGPVNVPLVAQRDSAMQISGGQDFAIDALVVGTVRLSYSLVYRVLP